MRGRAARAGYGCQRGRLGRAPGSLLRARNRPPSGHSMVPGPTRCWSRGGRGLDRLVSGAGLPTTCFAPRPVPADGCRSTGRWAAAGIGRERKGRFGAKIVESRQIGQSSRTRSRHHHTPRRLRSGPNSGGSVNRSTLMLDVAQQGPEGNFTMPSRSHVPQPYVVNSAP